MAANKSQSNAENGIARVVTIRRIGDPEPIKRYTPQEAIAEVEELRRMFISKFGDPDAPMARVVTKRRYEP